MENQIAALEAALLTSNPFARQERMKPKTLGMPLDLLQKCNDLAAEMNKKLGPEAKRCTWADVVRMAVIKFKVSDLPAPPKEDKRQLTFEQAAPGPKPAAKKPAAKPAAKKPAAKPAAKKTAAKKPAAKPAAKKVKKKAAPKRAPKKPAKKKAAPKRAPKKPARKKAAAKK